MSIRKVVSRGTITILALALLYGSYYTWNALPIISGYGAKTLCSCVMLNGRAPQDVIDNELGGGLLSVGTFSVNYEDSSASAKVYGMAGRKAIFRKGLGCTLVNEITEEELRRQPFTIAATPRLNTDTIPWPMGDLLAETKPEGIDFTKINGAIDAAFDEPGKKKLRRTRAVIVVYKGQLIAERYAPGFDRSSRLMGWSMTKSLTNSIVGVLVRQGKLDVHQRAPIETWAADNRKAIQLHHLLQASSGLKWKEIYAGPSDATNMLFKKKDAGLYAATVPLQDEPGKVFYYSSGTTNIISWITRQAIGDAGYHAFPYHEIFYKAGMYSMVIEPDPGGTFVGSSFSYATARDWARFGLLYLNDGMVNGERILPEGWVRYTTTPAPGAEQGEYGAQFWLNAGASGKPSNRTYPSVPQDLFWADGYEGQNVFILPSRNLVVVKLSLTTGNWMNEDQFLADIISALPE